MKGTLYASVWCSAPRSGAYTPMGISQYNRLPHQGISGGHTREGAAKAVNVKS